MGIQAILGGIRFFLAASFTFSAVSKWRSLRLFREQIADYQLVPYGLTAPLAWIVALLESATAIALVVPDVSRVGAASASGLLTVFIVSMSLAIVRGRRIPCACWGQSSELDLVGPVSITRTAVLLFTAFFMFVGGPGLPPWTSAGTAAITVIMACVILMIPAVLRLALYWADSRTMLMGLKSSEGAMGQ